MKIFIFLIALCYSCVICGQHYISVEEMVNNYKEHKNIDKLKNYDIIYNFEESSETGLFMEKSLLPSDLPDTKDIRTEWCFEYFPDHKEVLYLKKMYSLLEGNSEEISIYESKLAGRYKKNSLGFPAVWYSGKITVLSCPKNLFGEIVTKSVTEFVVDKGQVVSRKFLDKAKTGTMENIRSPRPDVKYSPIATLDGCWYSNLQYKLDLLEEFVNSPLKKYDMPGKIFNLDILLVTDKNGKATGYLLSPDEIKNKKEQILTEQLMKRIGELPLWSFGWLQTVDGSIFQGRYLKAEFLPGIGWKFEDYLH